MLSAGSCFGTDNGCPTALYKFCNQIAAVFYDFSWPRKLTIHKLILLGRV